MAQTTRNTGIINSLSIALGAVGNRTISFFVTPKSKYYTKVRTANPKSSDYIDDNINQNQETDSDEIISLSDISTDESNIEQNQEANSAPPLIKRLKLTRVVPVGVAILVAVGVTVWQIVKATTPEEKSKEQLDAEQEFFDTLLNNTVSTFSSIASHVIDNIYNSTVNATTTTEQSITTDIFNDTVSHVIDNIYNSTVNATTTTEQSITTDIFNDTVSHVIDNIYNSTVNATTTTEQSITTDIFNDTVSHVIDNIYNSTVNATTTTEQSITTEAPVISNVMDYILLDCKSSANLFIRRLFRNGEDCFNNIMFSNDDNSCDYKVSLNPYETECMIDNSKYMHTYINPYLHNDPKNYIIEYIKEKFCPTGHTDGHPTIEFACKGNPKWPNFVTAFQDFSDKINAFIRNIPNNINVNVANVITTTVQSITTKALNLIVNATTATTQLTATTVQPITTEALNLTVNATTATTQLTATTVQPIITKTSEKIIDYFFSNCFHYNYEYNTDNNPLHPFHVFGRLLKNTKNCPDISFGDSNCKVLPITKSICYSDVIRHNNNDSEIDTDAYITATLIEELFCSKSPGSIGIACKNTDPSNILSSFKDFTYDLITNSIEVNTDLHDVNVNVVSNNNPMIGK